MKLPKILTLTLKDSFNLVIRNPLLWIYFYVFVVLDIVVVNFVPSGVDRLLILILNLLIVGLPGLKVEFLSSLSKNRQPEYKQIFPLLFKYFKKLFWVNLFLIFIGSVFYVISSFVSSFLVGDYLYGDSAFQLLGYTASELVRLIIYLPLAIVYFSLFHLFVVVLVKKQKGVLETFKECVSFVKKNRKIVLWIVALSLLVHYPISEILMLVSSKFVRIIDPIILRGVVSFVNILIDLFFFAVWMVLYNKKS